MRYNQQFDVRTKMRKSKRRSHSRDEGDVRVLVQRSVQDLAHRLDCVVGRVLTCNRTGVVRGPRRGYGTEVMKAGAEQRRWIALQEL
jgi:hypothetical protein